jgi:GT2 family glycosyltransferase
LVDGDSRDAIELLKTITDTRFRWMTTPGPSGWAGSWNRVCREAKGKYILFCADDDVLLPNAVDEQVRLLESHPEVGFCHADLIYIDDDGAELGRWISHRGRFIDRGLDAWPDYLVATGCSMPSVVIRRDLWLMVGGWDDAGNPSDNALYLKLLRHSAVGHVDRMTCKYRFRVRTPDSWARQFRNLREYYALAMKHLADPPEPFSGSISRLTRQVLNRLVRDGVALRMSAPDERSRAELRDWLDRHVWRYTAFGCACRFLDRLHALGLVSAAHVVNLMCRQSAKWVLIRTLRRSAL